MRTMILMLLLFALCGMASAQGVNDPSTPNAGMVYPVRPPEQPARPTATPNIPPAAAPGLPLRVRRDIRSFGSSSRTSTQRR